MPDRRIPAKPHTLRDADALVAAGLIAPADRDAIAAVEHRYAVAIPAALQALIETPNDPIGRQFIPDAAELVTAPHERPDPIGDDALSPVKGVVHRYADRALLKPLLACPVYCRFCFRREHVGPDGGLLSRAELDTAIAWLAARPAIREVILTGGDPLMLSPRRLGDLLARLAAIPHVALLRIHSRVPVADPSLITNTMLASLEIDTPLFLALHINHARELTEAARETIRRIGRRGIPLLGQTVLLRGVNDSVDALEALFRAMLAARIKPYYLHQLDPAPGTARFHVPIAEGQRLLAALRGRVTGLAWPTYVLDIPGGHGKVPIGPTYLDAAKTVRDPAGTPHALAAALAAPGACAYKPAQLPPRRVGTRMKQQANLIRAGQVLEHDGRRWTVLKQQIISPGKGGAFIQVEMRDLRSGNKTNERWRTADTVERLITEEKEYTYSYTDGSNLVLMDPETFEQAMVPVALLGDSAPFLQDNMPVTVDLVEGDPVAVHLPASVVLEVAEADPVVKGQTASSSYKPAKLSNGVKTMVPPFIESGERIVVRIEDASYMERAKG